MSVTPRMKAAQMAAMEHGTGDVWRVGCDIELELNAANIEIEEKRKDVVWLATEKAKSENYVTELENRLRALWDKYDGDRKYYMERINRLQDIINRAHLVFFSDSSDRKVSIAMHRILDEEVRKESKP